jgi:ribosomal protein S24E
MSVIETVSDVSNSFLSRREITCNFAGLGGKLKKLEASEMITKEFKLDGKIVIPIKMKTHAGKPVVTGTFYVYEDEKIAKQQVSPVIFERLEKGKKKDATVTEEKPQEQKTEAAVEEKAEQKEAKTKEKEKNE